MLSPKQLTTGRRRPILNWPVGLLVLVTLIVATAAAQAQTNLADELAAQALAEPTVVDVAPAEAVAMPVLDLLFRGGWLMLPIGLMSVVVVALGVERTLALRRSQILPNRLANSMADMAEQSLADPKSIRRICLEYPSSAARVIEGTLTKIGRPIIEMERAVSEACQREADRLLANVRTLNLASTVAPLLGLLGTVWGMIQAFFATANMPLGSHKGEALAEGIYVALVTTFAGLSVAIPAAVLAHWFESRVLRQLRDVEDLLVELLPQWDERHEKLRIDDAHAGPSAAAPHRPTVHHDAKAS